MPPQLALLLWAGFVAFLFWREARQPSSVSRALWIPLLWVLITGSRFVSHWLVVWGLLPAGNSMCQEGSPLNAGVFSALILAGFATLWQRRLKVATLLRNNIWISVFILYCFVSIGWSDEPFTAFKRWVKTMGHPIMALVILTDPDPDEALRRLFKRASYLLLTGSVLLIKYFPHIGRGFCGWTGAATNLGVNLTKNELGYVCMLTGLFFVWNFLSARHIPDARKRREERWMSAGFLVIIWWLLSVANSITATVCLAAGVLMMLALGSRWINKRYLGAYIVSGLVVFAAAESMFGIYEGKVAMLGRDATLTDRTHLWRDVLELADDPLLGAGFESFWLGHRLETLWAKWAWKPIQAHNGYIETYVNLGAVGLALLFAVALSVFKKAQRMMWWDFEYGRLRLCFWAVLLLYNFTEAAFKGVSLVWLVWHIIALEYPGALAASRAPVASHEDESAEPLPQPGSASIRA